MEKKRLLKVLVVISLALALVVLPLMVACTAKEQQESPTQFTVGGGGVGGTFYAGASAIMTIINQNVEGIRATAISTGGSHANIQEIDKGEMLFGLAAESAAAQAYAGTGKYDRSQNINLIGFIGGSKALFVALDPSIKTISDMKGAKIAVGEPGSTDAGICMTILEGVGLKEGDYTAIQLGELEATAALMDGRVDAIFNQVRPGKPAIVELTTAKDCVFPKLPADKMDAISASMKDAGYPRARGSLLAGTFNGMTEEYQSFYAPSTFIVDSRADEELVYKVTKAWWENIEVMAKIHIGYSGLSPENIKEAEIRIPIHPGALRYYKEIGVLTEDPYKG